MIQNLSEIPVFIKPDTSYSDSQLLTTPYKILLHNISLYSKTILQVYNYGKFPVF